MARVWSAEDIAELALQDMENYESDPDTFSPPWEGDLNGWRRSAGEAGDHDTIECIDTVPDAQEIYERAGERLRALDEEGRDLSRMKRTAILDLLITD